MSNFINKLENLADNSSQTFPKLRIAAGFFLLLFFLTIFVIPYLGYSGFAQSILSFDANFQAKIFLVIMGVVMSALTIWAYNRWENILTLLLVIASFSMVAGSLLLFFYYPTPIFGILLVFALGGLTIFIPIVIIFAVAVTLAGVISLWILPIYRYFTDDKLVLLWLAIIFSLIATPVMAQFLGSGFVVRQSSQYQNFESEMNTEVYRMGDNTDLFSVAYTGREKNRYDFSGGYSPSQLQTPKDGDLIFKPEQPGVSGEFLVTHNSDKDDNFVSFKSKSGEVVYKSPSVCSYGFNVPETFSPDKTKYASQLVIDRTCQDLFVYDAVSREKTVIPGPYRAISWIGNQHIFLFDTDSDTLEFYSTETKEITPATVPYERFSGQQYNPSSMSELNADLHPGQSWLAVANTSPSVESCELLLLNPEEKRQIALTDFGLEKTCDAVRWQDENTLLLHEQGNGTLNRSGGKIYRLQFKQPAKIFQ